MEESEQAAIHDAFEAALSELAQHLGGDSASGGPVENATQVKGREDLGVLLTDAQDLVLGRVWVAFGAAVRTSDDLASEGGAVQMHAEVCSEVVEPPMSLERWLEDR